VFKLIIWLRYLFPTVELVMCATKAKVSEDVHLFQACGWDDLLYWRASRWLGQTTRLAERWILGYERMSVHNIHGKRKMICVDHTGTWQSSYAYYLRKRGDRLVHVIRTLTYGVEVSLAVTTTVTLITGWFFIHLPYVTGFVNLNVMSAVWNSEILRLFSSTGFVAKLNIDR